MTDSLKYFFAFVLTLIIFLALDFFWLGFLSKDMYRNSIGHLMSDKVNWAAAFIFYLIFLFGLFMLAIHPAVQAGSVRQVLWLSAVYGLCTYATYDFTNLATLKDWPVRLVLIDVCWGILLNTATGFAGFKIMKWLF